MTNESTEMEQDDSGIGAENETSEAADSLPGAPADKDAAAGDTDQHSSSDA